MVLIRRNYTFSETNDYKYIIHDGHDCFLGLRPELVFILTCALPPGQ